MIKLTREENELLKKFTINDDDLKQNVIKLLYNSDGELNRIFNTSELKLKVNQAILDGKWEVEEPLYYVHLMSGENGYLNIDKRDGTHFLSNTYDEFDKTKFTRAEVKAIDPRYLEFLEEVE
ncbi:hypothetical protein [Streptococcus phage Str-PAP-1]|uniref:Phage protein n=1 Tax=Streptococcus parauberis KRS-02083 TaxID=1207545 RepID=A0ABN0ITM3_9STRE|nr:DUF1642 domain-containing protein [Streptococcus parauberis]YP_009188504.1 DUF1642 domain-containing protein [Streptococcus phage Str-PAP-1]QBX18113.1 hypothetical protein Javan393_0033 [Streptococcus phage Javan393]AJD83118.1 hypothetical protein [Streptococcus phage Str-PAP-1]EMG26267.1 hypothetical protein SPJ1_0229 [Streptococcus parauberis KRS-02083]WEM65797.1 DUF1642 domain-containing protein [Streptococcus parauberis]WOF47677.1 DUF1642 domain-containing protein [Streptococcus paraub